MQGSSASTRPQQRCDGCSSAPTARGGGVARALLTTLLETARDLGYERVRLDTGDRLPEARGLFLTFGFRDIDDYNGNPYAAYWMELSLVSGLELRPGDA